MAATAVHLKTESGDDYLFMADDETEKDIVSVVVDSMGDELRYVYDILVVSTLTLADNSREDEVKEAIRDAIDAMEDDCD